ncbi:Uncharacterised protein [Acinetobacter baumannii]|nr:Uncharacterised protein [Acinetobacter baumannii]
MGQLASFLRIKSGFSGRRVRIAMSVSRLGKSTTAEALSSSTRISGCSRCRRARAGSTKSTARESVVDNRTSPDSRWSIPRVRRSNSRAERSIFSASSKAASPAGVSR